MILFIIYIILNIGIVTIFLIKNTILIKKVALSTTILTFYSSLFLWIFFEKNSFFFQYLFYIKWLSFLNINFILGLDGLSLFFVLLTTFLMPICITYCWTSITIKIKEFFLLFLFIELFLLFIFTILDLIIFYIFFESILIPMGRVLVFLKILIVSNIRNIINSLTQDKSLFNYRINGITCLIKRYSFLPIKGYISIIYKSKNKKTLAHYDRAYFLLRNQKKIYLIQINILLRPQIRCSF